MCLYEKSKESSTNTKYNWKCFQTIDLVFMINITHGHKPWSNKNLVTYFIWETAGSMKKIILFVIFISMLETHSDSSQ